MNEESDIDGQSLQNLSQGIPLQGGDFYQAAYDNPPLPMNQQVYQPERFLVQALPQQPQSLNQASTSFLTGIQGQPFYLHPSTTNLTSSSVFLLPNSGGD